MGRWVFRLLGNDEIASSCGIVYWHAKRRGQTSRSGDRSCEEQLHACFAPFARALALEHRPLLYPTGRSLPVWPRPFSHCVIPAGALRRARTSLESNTAAPRSRATPEDRGGGIPTVLTTSSRPFSEFFPQFARRREMLLFAVTRSCSPCGTPPRLQIADHLPAPIPFVSSPASLLITVAPAVALLASLARDDLSPLKIATRRSLPTKDKRRSNGESGISRRREGAEESNSNTGRALAGLA